MQSILMDYCCCDENGDILGGTRAVMTKVMKVGERGREKGVIMVKLNQGAKARGLRITVAADHNSGVRYGGFMARSKDALAIQTGID